MTKYTNIDDVWDESFDISSYHMDPFGSLKLTSLFELFQDAASKDASRKGFGYHELISDKRYWVLIRAFIRIIRIPKWEEKLRFQTWPKETNGIVAFRDFRIVSQQEEELILGTSTWTQLDIVSRRPVRIDLGERYKPAANRTVGLRKPSKIQQPDDLFWSDSTIVKYSQIDVNFHVNNTRYLEWVLNEIPFELLQEQEVREMEVNFLSEGKLNDLVRVGYKQMSENEWFACVERVEDKQSLYTVKFTFNKR